MTNLSANTRRRLTKLLGMLGSAHDGERASAARKASDLLHALDLQWQDVLAPPGRALAVLDDGDRADDDWFEIACECHDRRGRLSTREADFVQNLVARGERNRYFRLSDPQLLWLDSIHARLRR